MQKKCGNNKIPEHEEFSRPTYILITITCASNSCFSFFLFPSNWFHGFIMIANYILEKYHLLKVNERSDIYKYDLNL